MSVETTGSRRKASDWVNVFRLKGRDASTIQLIDSYRDDNGEEITVEGTRRQRIILIPNMLMGVGTIGEALGLNPDNDADLEAAWAIYRRMQSILLDYGFQLTSASIK